MLALGIDIGGTRIKAGVVTGEGRIRDRKSVDTPGTLEGFQGAIRELLNQLAFGDDELVGVGIGCKGIINPENSRVEALPGPLSFLEGLRLSDLIGAELREPRPILADNDARVAMAGERAWGAARNRSNAIMFTLGTGVGGAVVADGRVLRGTRGVAGHLGHVTVDPDGPLCMCGSRGCLETLFSARSIETEAFGVVHRGCESAMARAFQNEPNRLTCERVFQFAAEGDAAARMVVDGALKRLGAAIAGLVHVFDPEVVILGGQIAEAGAVIIDPVQKEIAWRTRRLLGREVPVVAAQVEDKSGVIGAAALVFTDLLPAAGAADAVGRA